MDASSQQSPIPDRDKEIREALERRQRDIASIGAFQISLRPSWGERLLPVVFAAMETCWIGAVFIGLASLQVFHSNETLMPLWAPFVLMVGAGWLVTYLEMREQRVDEGLAVAAVSGSSLIYLLIVLAILVIIWSSVYASSAWLFDPRWLLAMLNDILLFSSNAFHVLGVVALCGFFCWRGIRLSRTEIEPSAVYKMLRLGVGVILAVIILQTGSGVKSPDELMLLLLIPLFLSFALVAHGLAHVLFTRRAHPVGLQGSVVAQERALLTMISIIGALLLICSLLIGSLASPEFLVQMQHALAFLGLAYDWIIGVLVNVVVFLLTPLFWLLSPLFTRFQFPNVKLPPLPSSQPLLIKQHPNTPPEIIAAIAAALRVVLPFLFIALIFFLIWLALRRRRITLVRRNEDLTESLWSWELFLAQMKAFFLAFWRHFFPKPALQPVQAEVAEVSGEPNARSIREIYRALLKWSAGRGYPREKDETPYEFRQRLNEHIPLVEAELSTVTEAYNALRYGAVVPDEAEVARVREDWVRLQQKIQIS